MFCDYAERALRRPLPDTSKRPENLAPPGVSVTANSKRGFHLIFRGWLGRKQRCSNPLDLTQNCYCK